MIQLRTPLATAMIVSVAVLAASCTPAPMDTTVEPGTQPSTTTITGPTSTFSTTTSTTTSQPTAQVPVVTDLADWSIVAGPDASLLAAWVSDSVFLAKMSTEVGEGYLVAPLGGEGVVRSVPPGWIVQQAAAVGDRVFVVMDDEIEQESKLIEVLPDGGEKALYEYSGSPMFASEIGVSGDSLYFTSLDDTDSICVRRLDLANASQAEDVVCGEPGQSMFWLSIDGPTVSVVTGSPDANGCAQVSVVGPAGNLDNVTGDACVFQGAAGDTTVVWTVPPVPDSQGGVDYFDVPVRGLVDGEPADLGRGAAGSVVVCDNVAYWLRPQTDGTEIRAWQPGDEISVIYRSPDEGPGKRYATSKPRCAPGGVYIQRAGGPNDTATEVLLAPPVDWTVQIPEPTVGQPDPDTYLATVSAQSILSTWASTKTPQELVALAEQACADLDAYEPAEDRYQYMMDPATEAEWIQRAGFSDATQLWFWRQAATLTMCPRYYQFTVGE